MAERKIEYDTSEMEEVNPVPNLNLPDIVAQRCLRPRDGSSYRVFECAAKLPRPLGCRECGSIALMTNGYTPKPRLIHDINIGLTRVDLLVRVPRIKCKDCDASYAYSFECAPAGKQVTNRLYEQIRRASFSHPFSDVAAEFGYTEATIRNIFDEYAAELEEERGHIIAPRVLGIDEKHIDNEMRGIFVDDETGVLLEMTPQNKRESIIDTITSMVDYDKNIKIVTTDMANNYRSYIQECLPYAVQIIDKYHVFQDLSRYVAKAKTAIMEEIASQITSESDSIKADHLRKVRDLVVHNAYLFKFGKKKLTATARRMAIMADVCETFRELNHLRLLKEGFERVYEQANATEAEEAYHEWENLVPPTGKKNIEKWELKYGVKAALYKEFKTFHNTTKKWHEEILNYFRYDCKFTNATAEGINSTIQSINSQGRGYGFNRLRARALYKCSAGPATTYSIRTKTIESNCRSTWSELPPNCMGSMLIRPMQAKEAFIEEDTPEKADTPLCVLSYIDEQSEYYDFND